MTTPAAPESSEPAPATASTASPAPGGSPRLRNGELRRLVAQFLVNHADNAYTPREIARKLDRSSGAVGNALTALASKGDAKQTANTPLRYRATATTAAAATATAPTAAASTRKPRASAAAKPRTTTSATTAPAPAPAAPDSATTSTRGAARPSAEEPVTGPVVRPNGQMYHPRTLSGLPDVTVLRKLRDAGVPALLYGPPGTGKTSVVEAAFPDLVTVQGDGDTTVGDLVGEYTQTPDGRYVFVHGPLVRAMREGRPLFVDDATLIAPTVLAVVYPGMDGRRQIIIKANGGEVVDAAPGFYVIAGFTDRAVACA